MRLGGLALGLLAGLAGAAAAQDVRLDAGFSLVTDRNAGVQAALPAARGLGFHAALSGRMARFEAELFGIGARLGLPEAAPTAGTQTFAQLEARVRYRVVGPLSAEGGLVGRSLSPDPNGAAVGFATAGVFGRWQLARDAWISGRLGYIPWARFEGGGSVGFAAEMQLGLEVALTGAIRATAVYAFQRLDRELRDPDGVSLSAPVEHDLLRVGVRWLALSPAPRRPSE